MTCFMAAFIFVIIVIAPGAFTFLIWVVSVNRLFFRRRIIHAIYRFLTDGGHLLSQFFA